MINSSGVIFSYTPSQTQKKHSAGPIESRSTQPAVKTTVPQQKHNQQQSVPKKLPVKPIQQVQKHPQPLKQPRNFPPKPLSQAPFPPLPGYNSAFPQYPKPGNRPAPSPWNNPFAYPGMQRPPSKFAQAKTLEEFIPAQQQTPKQQFHNGLPIEEIPEILPNPSETIHTIDTTYVDKLFGMKPQTSTPQSEAPRKTDLHMEEMTVQKHQQATVTETTGHAQPPSSHDAGQFQHEEATPWKPLPVQAQQAPIQQTNTNEKTPSVVEKLPQNIEQIPSTDEHNKPVESSIVDAPTQQRESSAPQTETETIKPSEGKEQPAASMLEPNIQPKNAPSPYIPEGLAVQQPQPQIQKKKHRFHIPFLKRQQKETSSPVHSVQQTQPASKTQASTHESENTPPPSSTDVLKPNFSVKKAAGVALIIVALLGLTVPFVPKVMLERTYAQLKRGEEEKRAYDEARPLPQSVPIGFNPMMAPDGSIVEPINTEFSIVIPAVGINAPVLPGIDPLDSKSYMPALKVGVAHAKTSYFPNQQGSVYLFSHSTNYEWFVNDLNAVFYNVKNLEPGQYIILFYEGKRYVYEYKESKVVSPKDTAELIPESGKRELILQTCWPPGSLSQRLLLYADLVEIK